MNNDLLQFARDFLTWRSPEWKSLANLLTSAQNRYSQLAMHYFICYMLIFAFWTHTNPVETDIDRSFRHCRHVISKYIRLDVDWTSIRRESVRSMPYRRRSEGLCYLGTDSIVTWSCHEMETFSALLAICAENSFHAQRQVTRSLNVSFDLRLNKRLSKQSWGWWFETLPFPLWRHCNDITRMRVVNFASYSCTRKLAQSWWSIINIIRGNRSHVTRHLLFTL